jgi:hypothetical protein
MRRKGEAVEIGKCEGSVIQCRRNQQANASHGECEIGKHVPHPSRSMLALVQNYGDPRGDSSKVRSAFLLIATVSPLLAGAIVPCPGRGWCRRS